MSGGWSTNCEFCRVPSGTGWTYKACGMSYKEHKRMAKLQKKAKAEAHARVVAAREQELLPRAMIRELYDGADVDVAAFLKQYPRDGQ
jgi:hypothetical protein